MEKPTVSGADKRVERSVDAVLTETYRLLTESGIGGVSVEEISRRSGVAKTTIYRHWPSRSALLLDACSKLGGSRPIPDSGSFAGDIAALARDLAAELRAAQWASILPSIIDAAERDPDLARVHAALHEALMSPFVAVTERAQRRGELSSDRSPTEVVASLVGPLFYRRWFSKEPMDDEFVTRLVSTVTERA
ncbi:TetR/AcrR family transcriptional regulator [Mycobacterium sp. 4858]|uniref:TetR/AcrR family transcriptional regulator n=1 Tax=Mycobacterium sp. 4858 TaxID=2057185 RepID=UPI0018EC7443|nr:TetR/AcrR family transcriptional regulator [Mycobacterium sp. 4858]